MYMCVYLLEEVAHFTDNTLLLHALRVAPVTVGEEVVTQNGSVYQCLNDATHETCVAKVIEASKTCGYGGER